MAAYTVHAPPDGDPERIRLVKEGFCWPALFFPALWLLWHRMWIPFVLYLVYAAALYGLGTAFPDAPIGFVALLGAVLLALEANNLRRWSLARRGWSELGGTFGRTLDEAEMRYFKDHAREARRAPAQQPAPRTWPAYQPDRREGDEVMGLFPRAGT